MSFLLIDGTKFEAACLKSSMLTTTFSATKCNSFGLSEIKYK